MRIGLSNGRLGAVLFGATMAFGLCAAVHGEARAGANADPMQLVVSLSAQRMDVYRGAERVDSAPVSTGRKGKATPTGIFSILQKRRWHRSNIYSGAPMPFMQRMTWSGIALHAGHLPGYPASGGCIRMRDGFARQLFGRTRIGLHVAVVEGEAVPRPFAHDALLQPLPPEVSPPPVPVAKQSATRLAKAAPHREAASDAAMIMEAAATVQNTHAEREREVYLATLAAYRARPQAPLRILLTRREGRERVKDVQRLLHKLGYDAGTVDGLIGPVTGRAIAALQKDLGMRPTGAISEDLVEILHQATGRSQVVHGHIYVRQDFEPVFDAPVTLRDPGEPLGTHLFTAMHFEDGDTHVPWTALAMQDDAERPAEAALARFDLPPMMRERLSRMLTPGSSVIVTDAGLGDLTTPRGTDFVVVTR